MGGGMIPKKAKRIMSRNPRRQKLQRETMLSVTPRSLSLVLWYLSEPAMGMWESHGNGPED